MQLISRFSSGIERASLLYSVEKWFQIRAGRYPALFFLVHRLARKNPMQAVSRETEIVIEGFPRSACSFAVAALRQAQQRPLCIASHLHVPAQVLRGSAWGIPILVIIRSPKDAVLSLMVRDGISASQALTYYIAFYESVAKHREALVLASFDEVTKDYGAVIKRINKKFSTTFALFRDTKASLNKVFSAIDAGYRSYDEDAREKAISRPSAAKEQAKQDVAGQLHNPRCIKLLSRAETLYERLTAKDV